jgi:hypothetical protein
MADKALPAAVQQLIARHLRSVDHVSVLLALRAAAAVGEAPIGSDDIAARVGVAAQTAAVIADELALSRLLSAQHGRYLYAPDAELASAVDELALMYNTRPVTLVRAIYDRPASAVQDFADAFRLRTPEET